MPEPLAQVQIRDATGELVTVRTSLDGYVKDSTGTYIRPADMRITGTTRDGNGNILTQTIADEANNSWVQTYTRDGSGYLNTQSLWVKQ